MLDVYSRKARLAPAALAATPAVALIASVAIAPIQTGSAAAVVAGAMGVLICGVVRDFGRRLQPELWASWGGSPTTQRLRWTNAADQGAVERLHRRMNTLLDNRLPTRDEEAAHPSHTIAVTTKG